MRVQRGHISVTPHELFSFFTLALYFWVLAFTLNRDHWAVSFVYHVKIKYIIWQPKKNFLFSFFSNEKITQTHSNYFYETVWFVNYVGLGIDANAWMSFLCNLFLCLASFRSLTLEIFAFKNCFQLDSSLAKHHFSILDANQFVHCHIIHRINDTLCFHKHRCA